MKTAFVTGAAGFVGSHVVRDLLAHGWAVRALLRTPQPPALAGLDVTEIPGDFFAPGIAEAMRGCDAVFHVAALYTLWRRDAAAVYRANVDGTAAILAAAREAGVPRVVHTSSVAAIGIHDHVATEADQHPLAELVGAYKKSKLLGEQVARAAFERGQDVVIVNPSTPIGPGDSKPTPTSAEIIIRFVTGGMPAYVDTGLNLVDVRDVAAGHRLAYERGTAGERYILGHENLTLQEIFTRLGAISGTAVPKIRLPRAIPLVYAAIGEFLLAPLGVKADVPFDSVRMSHGNMFYSAAKAVRDLELPQSDVTSALADAVHWFDSNGYLRSRKDPAPAAWPSPSNKP